LWILVMPRSLAGLRLQTTGWLGPGEHGLNDGLLQGLPISSQPLVC
jgi:hypothetical protein